MFTDLGSSPDKALQINDLQNSTEFQNTIEKFVSNHFPLLYFRFRPSDIPTLKETLLDLRTQNLSFILLLEERVPAEHTEATLQFLKMWDNLLIRNLYKLFPILEEPTVQKHLRPEAMIELLWFREWNLALTDSRVAMYPNLPWRSYLRRINSENFKLANQLITAAPEQVAQILLDFLDSRKKVVCLFPKNWSKG